MSYDCKKCGNRHNLSSEIGKEHKKFQLRKWDDLSVDQSRSFVKFVHDNLIVDVTEKATYRGQVEPRIGYLTYTGKPIREPDEDDEEGMEFICTLNHSVFIDDIDDLVKHISRKHPGVFK